ncbi:MAG TPA: M20/M25/M40 family metallo-hydrolase [Bryobacteraceae bacterium]
MNTALQRTLAECVDQRRDRLVEIAQELIRRPSENTPPRGAEAACQMWIASCLTRCGMQPDLYTLGEVAELESHPLFYPARDYTGRPNIGARRKGVGGGRSLVLSGHIDTVPRGTQNWTHDPFGGEVEGNRIFGRGSNDMKAGIAMNLFVMECLEELELPLQGDLVFETVIDEEFGGCNGTLAGRLRGHNAEAAILSEPSFLRICPAQRGGRTAHITFRTRPAGVLENGRFPQGAIPQLSSFLAKLPTFASQRKARAPVHEMYAGHADPVPVSITKIATAPWGYNEPITIPDTARLELYWQLMPGETQDAVEREFFDWLRSLMDSDPQAFPVMPEVSFPIRWLPGSSIPASEPLVQQLSGCARAVLGVNPPIAGIEGPCDLFIFHRFGIPAALWGPSGGNTHGPDEYVEIDSMIAAAKTLLLFTAEWCGTR